MVLKRGCSTCLQLVYPWKYSTFPIMNFFKTWHVHFGYLYGLPQRVSKIWDDFYFYDFMGSPLWIFNCNLWMTHFQKTQRGDPMKSGKSKLSQTFNTRCGKPYRYTKCTCQVLKKFIIGKVEYFQGYTTWRQVEHPL